MNQSSWNTCGPDTVHVTFKEGPYRTPMELASLLDQFQNQYGLPSAVAFGDRGVQGFANSAVDKAAGFRMDWTRPEEAGNNPGFFCLQIKGEWFTQADGETAVDMLQLMQAYGPYRITRLDLQQTTRTTTRLTPWWIAEFEAGNLRVLGKKHYEPRGKRDHLGDYPLGATLYHGSRASDSYARQYDKHLQTEDGPPRRRDEVELKGERARQLWDQMHEELLLTEQLGTSRGVTLHAFSKSAIRALLPIRDTSRWAGKPLPKHWTQLAKEPTTWATLFDDHALEVKPRERKLSSLLKSYRYANENFGAPVSVMAAYRIVQRKKAGEAHFEACENAFIDVLDDFTRKANEERARDFIAELPVEDRGEVEAIWLEMSSKAGSNLEDARD